MENKVFKRKIFKKMLQWKTESDGKTALLIEGARRVGKSTVVEEFARSHLTSSLRHPKIFIKEFCDFLVPCH